MGCAGCVGAVQHEPAAADAPAVGRTFSLSLRLAIVQPEIALSRLSESRQSPPLRDPVPAPLPISLREGKPTGTFPQLLYTHSVIQLTTRCPSCSQACVCVCVHALAHRALQTLDRFLAGWHTALSRRDRVCRVSDRVDRAVRLRLARSIDGVASPTQTNGAWSKGWPSMHYAG